MKPYHTFIFILTTVAGLLLLSWFFPEKGLHITSDLTLKFPHFEELINPPKKQYKDISNILDDRKTFIPDTTINKAFGKGDSATLSDTTFKTEKAKDTIREEKKTKQKETEESSKTDNLKAQRPKKQINKDQLYYPLAFPDGNASVIHPFFHALRDLQVNKKLIRVLHYGDSQIEGDRITSYIRNRLQDKFGGNGIGLFPIRSMRHDNVSVIVSTSDNWRHYSIRNKKKLPSGHKHYGILTSFGRFNPFNAYLATEPQTYKAWVDVKKRQLSYQGARSFDRFRLFYGYNQQPFITHMEIDEKGVEGDIIPPNNDLNIIEWEFDQTPNEFRLSFEGYDSPDVFAISLDGNHGVAVDNISLRGSSGLEFTKTNENFYKKMYGQLNVRLVLLQFGVNVVPNVVRDYTYYEVQLVKQLRYIKKMHPNVAIILIGVSDMSRKKDGTLESWPNIKKIRNAQRRAAFRTGCAFWDMYAAMGGENSMPGWVNAEPQLARSDYTHFTYKGSKVIAEMFTNALLKEYETFIRNDK